MIVYSAIALALTIGYILLFLFYLTGWFKLLEFFPSKKNFQTRVSIIIPARNEEANLGALLNDLLNQNFPKHLFEILLVDDFSEDGTAGIAASFSSRQIQIVQLKGFIDGSEKIFSYKKKALEIGIGIATGELIITTDADCRMNPDWLSSLVDFYETKKCHMIIAPVVIKDEKNFFQKFQSLDLLGLAGITGATMRMNFPAMCNGANLAFKKKSFYEVNGYEGINEKTSGDDVLLMYKMVKRWKHGVLFLKNNNAVVFTQPQKSVAAFLKQRMRWTSKSGSYADRRITLNLLLIYLFNFSIVTSLLLVFIDFHFIFVFLPQLILKSLLDFIFLNRITKYYGRQKLMRLFLPTEIAHLFYIIIAGFAGNLFTVNWKGRIVK